MVPELLAGRCQTYVTGSKGISHWESGKNVCVSGRLSVGLIRWTGYVCQYEKSYIPFKRKLIEEENERKFTLLSFIYFFLLIFMAT